MTDLPASEYVLNSFKQYAIYVCETRSIPRATDGLKSSQRKAIWVAKGKKEKIKTISLAGEMISKGLYVHGDQSASQAISLMAAPFCNNIPFFIGYGAFGTKVNPYGFGAPRYTYVKLNPFIEKLLFVDSEIIPMVDNYDGSTKEPLTFVPLIPLVFLNGVSGIAVGWSTEILRHDLEDIIQATIDVLKNKNIDNIKPFYKDFNIDIYEEENLKYVFSGKIEIINSTTVKITSLPPDYSLEKLKENLNNLCASGKIKDYEDVSTNNIEVIVKFSREILKKYNYEKLIDLFKLKVRKTERIVVIDFDGNTIKQYENHQDFFRNFVEWRKKLFYDRYKLKIKQAEEKIRFLDYLKKLHENEFVVFCGKASNKAKIVEFVKKVCEKIKDEELNKIINLPLYRWTKEDYDEIKAEMKKLKEDIKKYNEIIKSDRNIVEKYIEELEKLKIDLESHYKNYSE